MSGPGLFIAVVGPSGAGKDTLIGEARRAVARQDGIVFPRRVVTRPSSPHEDNEAIGEAEFAARCEAGAFALWWQAHGLHYGIPRGVRDDLSAGHTAICNLSRGAVPEAKRVFSRVAVVLVTAPRAVIVERLAARGREHPEAIAARLEREASIEAALAADLVIANVADPAEGGRQLAAFALFGRQLGAGDQRVEAGD